MYDAVMLTHDVIQMSTFVYGMFQHCINAQSYPVAQLCVNTLLATKVNLITGGI
jgi:hypothetical protein